MATLFQKTTEFTRGLRFRLSVIYSALFGICLILLSLFTTNEYLDLARQDYDQALRNFALDLSEHATFDQSNVFLDMPLNQKIKSFPFLIQETTVIVRDLDGGILYRSSPTAEIPYGPDIARRSDFTHRYHTFQLQADPMRAINLKFKPPRGESMIIQVASTLRHLQRQQERHYLFLLVIIPLTIFISAIFSTAVAGKALEPIRMTVRTMENLLRNGNYQSLPVPQTRDEIEELTRTFNTMLSQLQSALVAQEQFVSHASHQLNTPLAIMRGELEVLRSKERSTGEVADFHQSLQQELERLSLLVRDMLLVSRVEAGKEHFRFAPLRVDDVLGETLERLSSLARKKQVTLRFDIDPVLIEHDDVLTLPGERQLLTVLFENIIENAVKYSPSPSQVAVRLRSIEDGFAVEVEDQGPGIPAVIAERLLNPRRFVRGEKTGTQGSGLGLYLASRIADYHGMILAAASARHQGSIIKVRYQIPRMRRT
jgi:signal transduction histidine kinase